LLHLIIGKPSDDRFIKLSRDYEQEQAQLKAVVETLGREVKQQERRKPMSGSSFLW